MRWHWQNLNEKLGGGVGSGLRHGRAWLYVGRYTLGWEWVFFGRPACHAYVAVDSDPEGTLGASIAVPKLFALYVHLDCPWGYRIAWLTQRKPPGEYDKYGTRREIGVHVHDRAFWWDIWADMNEWRSKDWRWMHGCWHPVDTILGRNEVTYRLVETEEVLIPMPEGTYPGVVTIKERIDKRSRWFARRRLEAWLEIPKGIPFPGKGENSWDCGMDGLFGIGSAEPTAAAVVGRAVASVLESRRCYGGRGWQVPAASA